MKKIKESTPSPYRTWYNEWVENNAKGEVLDVGKSRFWDYGWKTIDTNKKLNPTYVGSICQSNMSNNIFDMILCNGMYECVDMPQKMVDECLRMVRPDGRVIFGFVGKGYKPYKTGWKSYEEGRIVFNADIVERKDFDDKYHFIICRKPFSKSKRSLADNL